MTVWLFIAAGGAGAAVVHHSVASAVATRLRTIFLLNLAASFAIGACTASRPPQWLHAFLIIGFLSSLTPFGALALATVELARERRSRTATAYLVINVIGGVAMALLGYLAVLSATTLYGKFA